MARRTLGTAVLAGVVMAAAAAIGLAREDPAATATAPAQTQGEKPVGEERLLLTQTTGPLALADQPGRGEERDAASIEARARLSRKGDITADKHELGRMFDFVATNAGVTMKVDWESLEEFGIERKTPITLEVHDVTWSRILDLLLKNAGDGDTAAWMIDEGVVTVGSADSFNRGRWTFIRCYDLTDLYPSSGPYLYAYNLHRSLTLDYIRLVAAPESWRETGGITGHCHMVGPMLIVGQNARGHREVAQAVALLKEHFGVSTRAYDIRDIIANSAAAKVVEVPSTQSAGPSPRVKQIMHVIKSHVMRDGWRDDDAPTPTRLANSEDAVGWMATQDATLRPSTMLEFDGKLIITTTNAGHRQVEHVLGLLRGTPATRPATAPAR